MNCYIHKPFISKQGLATMRQTQRTHAIPKSLTELSEEMNEKKEEIFDKYVPLQKPVKELTEIVSELKESTEKLSLRMYNIELELVKLNENFSKSN